MKKLTVTIHVEIDLQLVKRPGVGGPATVSQVRQQLLDQLAALPALRQPGVTAQVEVTS